MASSSNTTSVAMVADAGTGVDVSTITFRLDTLPDEFKELVTGPCLSADEPMLNIIRLGAGVVRHMRTTATASAAVAAAELAVEARYREQLRAMAERELAARAELERLRADQGMQLTLLHDNFSRVFSTRTATADKGRAGEAGLAELLRALYPAAEVTSTAASAETGDLMFVLARASRQYRIMFESKNMSVVQKVDVDKFERDCRGHARTAARFARTAAGAAAGTPPWAPEPIDTFRVDGAIFAAVSSGNIPHRGELAFDWVVDPESGGRLPVVYVASVFSTREALHTAIEAILFAAATAACSAEGETRTAAAADSRVDSRLAAAADVISAAFDRVERQGRRLGELRASAATLHESALATMSAAERMRAAAADLEGECELTLAAARQLWVLHPELKRDPPQVSAGIAAVAADKAESTLRGRNELGAVELARIRAFISQNGRAPLRPELLRECGLSEERLREVGGTKAAVAAARA